MNSIIKKIRDHVQCLQEINYRALLGISQMFQEVVEWVGEENNGCSQTEFAAGKLPSRTQTFRNCVRRLSCPITLWAMVNQISLYFVAAETQYSI